MMRAIETVSYTSDAPDGTTVGLPAAVVRRLSHLHSALGVAHILLEWTAVVVAAWVTETFWHPLLYAAAVVWIGSRQHALAIMAHDGVHGLIVRNRRVNDLLAELLLAWPVLVPFRSYRHVHRLHHRHLGTERDPDFARNRPDRLGRRGGPFEFARIMLGLNAEQRGLLAFFAWGDVAVETERLKTRPWLRGGYYALVLGVAWAFGGLSLLGQYWLVPLCTWFLFCMRLKGTAEHFAVEGREPLNLSRSIRPGPLTRLLIAPKQVYCHIEHHLYPSVPHYRLRELQAELMKHPGFAERAHVTGGYLAFLRECTRFGSERRAR
jgi:fatty acid desaturase